VDATTSSTVTNASVKLTDIQTGQWVRRINDGEGYAPAAIEGDGAADGIMRLVDLVPNSYDMFITMQPYYEHPYLWYVDSVESRVVVLEADKTTEIAVELYPVGATIEIDWLHPDGTPVAEQWLKRLNMQLEIHPLGDTFGGAANRTAGGWYQRIVSINSGQGSFLLNLFFMQNDLSLVWIVKDLVVETWLGQTSTIPAVIPFEDNVVDQASSETGPQEGIPEHENEIDDD
jgi:hypothetical protein